ncbi:MAG: hypothetical protein J7647_31235 [Cyanobacteria bacterium SBLK]|nr:hypothetical protein [Cyanobacteria bacterium SBLK]
MLAHHRKFVCLSLSRVDLPLQSTIETAATLYRKDAERFHVLLKKPTFPDRISGNAILTPKNSDGLLWLELSAHRVIMTMQGQGKLGYRHFWEKDRYGTSRYWLHGDTVDRNGSLQLKNFTHRLHLSSRGLPHRLHLEYQLYSGDLQLGEYILDLEIQL